ncbi:SRPBCC family protein [Falsirhodobacter sp. 1013]|uniref:SRPBCC family protein n=1 Tax=Falsirhodobacter sp. 1013 TaxID=3417566 RepID=UPI003EBC31E9
MHLPTQPTNFALARPRLDARKAHSISTALGWFSIGLGVAELLAPRRFTHALALDGQEGLVQAYGVRELICGFGILTNQGADRAPWMLGRLGGDMADMATVGAATARADSGTRVIGGATLLGLAGLTALDALCAEALSSDASPRGNQRRATGGPTADDPEVEQVILVDRPAETLRDLLTKPETLVAIAGFHADIAPRPDGSTSWSLSRAHGLISPWTMRLTGDDDRSVQWRSEEGGFVSSITFHLQEVGPDRGTAVRMHIRFDPPGGMLGRAAVSFLGPTTPKAYAMKSLHFLKSLALTGEVPTTKGQPAARDDRR